MSEVATVRVFTGKLHRVRRGLGHAFSATPPPPARTPVRRPARVAVMLALAHKIQDAIDKGVIRDQAEAARRLGITRARVTQLLDLTLLAPEIQERLLFAEAVNGVEPLCEHGFRGVIRAGRWEIQRERWTMTFGPTSPSGLESVKLCPTKV